MLNLPIEGVYALSATDDGRKLGPSVVLAAEKISQDPGVLSVQFSWTLSRPRAALKNQRTQDAEDYLREAKKIVERSKQLIDIARYLRRIS